MPSLAAHDDQAYQVAKVRMALNTIRTTFTVTHPCWKGSAISAMTRQEQCLRWAKGSLALEAGAGCSCAIQLPLRGA